MYEVLACDWNEKQGMAYINSRLPENKRIKDRTYRSYKKFALDDEALNNYFNEHTQIGFIREHKLRMEELKFVQKELMQNFYFQVSVDEEKGGKKDDRKIVAYAQAIATVNARLEQISLSNPIIAAVKKKIDTNDGSQSAVQQTIELDPLTQRRF